MNHRPPLLERAKIALDVFKNGYPRRRTYPPAPPARKQVPFLWPQWRLGTPSWQMTDLSSYIEEGFDLNTLIYSAMMYKFRAVSAAPLRAYTGDPDHPDPLPPSAPLAKLIDRPNPHMSKSAFVGLVDIYLNLAGSAPVWIIRKERNSLVDASLYPVRPDRVYIVPQPDARQILGYLYVPEGKNARDGVPILPQDMMFPKLPNPGDNLDGLGYGLSPFSPLAHSADVDNMVTKFLKLFFERGTMLTGILKFDVPLDDGTIASVKERWAEMYGGMDNWDQIGVLDQGGSYERLGMTFDEMGFETIDERNESRILGPFGIPPQLINARLGMKHSTYNNWEEARRAFWEDTMVAELGLLESEFKYFLQDGKAWAAFDLSGVPALQRNILALVTAWKELVTTGVPKKTAAELVGLDIGELPDGDVVYMPVSLVPVGKVGEPLPALTPPAPEKPAPKPEPETDNEGAAEAVDEERAEGKSRKVLLSTEAKAAHWKAVDNIARSWEARFAKAAAEAFEHDRRAILALITKAKKKALESKATVDWSGVETDAAEYLAGKGADNWRKVFVPLVQGVVIDQGERWAAELGLVFDAQNLFARDWYNAYTLTFAQPINETTGADVASILARGQKEGASIPQMQKQLGALFDRYISGTSPEDPEFDWYTDRLPAYRTELIARTETTRASSAGTNALFGEWGVKRREWLATQDSRVRDDHSAASGQVRAMDEPFDVGGVKMMYPGDPGAPLDQVANCRCTLLPVIE